jgi:hypothetical protein
LRRLPLGRGKRNLRGLGSPQEEFEALLDEHRRNDGRYDVIVPCSGGKDSGSIAHKLKYEYGMHPLTVTWSPLLYTILAFRTSKT